MPQLNKLEIISRLTRMACDLEEAAVKVQSDTKMDSKRRMDALAEVRLDQAALRRSVAIFEATMAPVVESAPCSDLNAKDKHQEALRDTDEAEQRSK